MLLFLFIDSRGWGWSCVAQQRDQVTPFCCSGCEWRGRTDVLLAIKIP